MAEAPWHSLGGGKAILREQRIDIQNSDGTDLIHIGKDEDGRWALSFYEADGSLLLRAGEIDDDQYGFALYDSDGNLRAEIGELDQDRYGVRTLLADGTELFRTDDRGLILPPLAVPMINRVAAGDEASTNSGSFTGLWYGIVPATVQQGIDLTVSVGQDPGVTGEIRAVMRTTGASGSTVATSATYSFTSAKRLRLAWLHGATIPLGRVEVRLDMRVSAGVGNVNSGRPYGVYFTGPTGMERGAGAWTDVTGE